MSSRKYALTVLITMVWILSAQPGFARDTGKFGVGLRVSYYGIQDDTINAFGIDSDSESDDTALFEVNFTYFFCRYFSLELSGGYTQTDMDIAFLPMGSIRKYGELEQIPILLTGRFHWPVTEWFSPYVGGGAGYYTNDIDRADGPGEFFNPAPASVEAFADDEFGFHAAAGVEFFISDHFALNLDVKYIWLQVDIGFEGGGFFSEGSSNLDALTAGVGLKYYF